MEQVKSEWITVKQALELLQITSRTTLYKFALKYNVRATKPLGRLYYNYNDIIAALENKAVVMGI
jgi:hypothetical protein